MSDVGRKVVPDKGRLNRELPVTKALSFHLAQEQRQNGKYGGRIPSKKRKVKAVI